MSPADRPASEVIGLNVEPVGYGARDRAVEVRRPRGLPELLVVAALRDRPRQDRRVEGRLGAHGQHAAVARVERDERPGHAGRGGDRLLQRLLAGLLEVGVERQLHGAALLGLRGLVLALGPAERVDHDARLAVRAAQVAVVGLLDAVLADDLAAHDALEAPQAQLAGVDLPHRAQELGGELVLRVPAQVGALDVQAREALLALEQVVAHRGGHARAQRDPRVGGQHEGADDAVVDRLRAEPERGAQPPVQQAQPRRGDRGHGRAGAAGPARRVRPAGDLLAPRQRVRALGLGELLRVELDDGGDFVLDQHAAVAVDDLPARGGDALGPRLVVAGLGQVLVAREDLQVPEAEEDDAEDRERHEAEHGHAQRQRRADRGAPVLGARVDHPERSRAGTPATGVGRRRAVTPASAGTARPSCRRAAGGGAGPRAARGRGAGGRRP